LVQAWKSSCRRSQKAVAMSILPYHGLPCRVALLPCLIVAVAGAAIQKVYSVPLAHMMCNSSNKSMDIVLNSPPSDHRGEAQVPVFLRTVAAPVSITFMITDNSSKSVVAKQTVDLKDFAKAAARLLHEASQEKLPDVVGDAMQASDGRRLWSVFNHHRMSRRRHFRTSARGMTVGYTQPHIDSTFPQGYVNTSYGYAGQSMTPAYVVLSQFVPSKDCEDDAPCALKLPPQEKVYRDDLMTSAFQPSDFAFPLILRVFSVASEAAICADSAQPATSMDTVLASASSTTASMLDLKAKVFLARSDDNSTTAAPSMGAYLEGPQLFFALAPVDATDRRHLGFWHSAGGICLIFGISVAVLLGLPAACLCASAASKKRAKLAKTMAEQAKPSPSDETQGGPCIVAGPPPAAVTAPVLLGATHKSKIPTEQIKPAVVATDASQGTCNVPVSPSAKVSSPVATEAYLDEAPTISI